MFKRTRVSLIVLVMVSLSVIVGGCAPSGDSYLTSTPTPMPSVTPPSNPLVPIDVDAPPSNQSWISPAKVKIGGYVWTDTQGHVITSDMPTDHAECPICKTIYLMKPEDWIDKRFHVGAEADYAITVHNGDLGSVRFSLVFSVPFGTSEGFLKAPKEVGDWVIIADPTPVLGGRQTKDIMVTLRMPTTIPDDVAIFYQNTGSGVGYLAKARADTVENLELQRGMLQQKLAGYADVVTRINELKGNQGLMQVLLKEFPYRQPEIEKAWQDTMAELNRQLVSMPHVLPLVYLEQESTITARRLNSQVVNSDELAYLTTNNYVTVGNLRTDKWEFWIIVCQAQTGQVQTQMASRWQVVMKS